MSYNAETALGLMRTRLNRLPGDTSLDSYFQARLDAAAQELTGNGIELTNTVEDTMLVVDVAVWQYSNRDSAAGMPPWLRLRRRERWLREAGANDS